MNDKKNQGPWSGFLLLTILSSVSSEKLIIDTDAGSDDAMAISVILSKYAEDQMNFDVVAITCSYGNTYLENVEVNVLKTLTVLNKTNIPVYSGARKPLTSNFTSDNFFGMDGLGDFMFDEKITLEIDRSKHAAIVLVELARKYKGEMNVLVLGPTTNIAIAITLDPDFVNNVKRFYIMGGSVSGIGNIRPGVEFNFGMDPESSSIVLGSIKDRPSLLLPWETIFAFNVSMEWRRNTISPIASNIIKFLDKTDAKLKTWRPSDVLAAAIMLSPNLIEKSLVTNITPMLCGEGRGGLLVDFTNMTKNAKNVEIVQKVEIKGFKEFLLASLS